MCQAPRLSSSLVKGREYEEREREREKVQWVLDTHTFIPFLPSNCHIRGFVVTRLFESWAEGKEYHDDNVFCQSYRVGKYPSLSNYRKITNNIFKQSARLRSVHLYIIRINRLICLRIESFAVFLYLSLNILFKCFCTSKVWIIWAGCCPNLSYLNFAYHWLCYH